MNRDVFPRREEPESNEAAAARWLIDQAEGLSPEEEQAFAAWRSDPRNAAAFARLEQTQRKLMRLPELRGTFASTREDAVVGAAPGSAIVLPATPVRGRLPCALRYTLAAAAALVLAALGWWSRPRSPPAAVGYATVAGAYQRITLADGSVLELNSDSRVEVLYSAQERAVLLTAGEAYFSVARDPGRPFVVQARAVAVHAVGTAFNVRLGSEEVDVLVTEGRVAIGAQARSSGRLVPRARAQENAATEMLAEARDIPEKATHAGSGDVIELVAGQRALVPHEQPLAPPRVEAVPPEKVFEALAWQERKLVFVDTPLREVAQRFNRRNRIQLVVADAELAERPVGGTFAADNVATFVRLLEQSGDVTLERRGEWEIVLRKTR